MTVFGVASFFVVLFSPELAELAVSASVGFSRWWALAPLVLLVLYGLMKANYEEYSKVKTERDELLEEKETEEQRAAIGAGLLQLYDRGAEMRVEVMNSTDESPPSVWQDGLSSWRVDVVGYLEDNVSAGKAQYVDAVRSVRAVSRSGMKSHTTRPKKEVIVGHLDERLTRLAEVMREY